MPRRAPSDGWSSRKCLRDLTFPAERFNSAADMQRESQTMLAFLCLDACHDSQIREGTTYSREMDTPERDLLLISLVLLVRWHCWVSRSAMPVPAVTS